MHSLMNINIQVMKIRWSDLLYNKPSNLFLELILRLKQHVSQGMPDQGITYLFCVQ